MASSVVGQKRRRLSLKEEKEEKEEKQKGKWQSDHTNRNPLHLYYYYTVLERDKKDIPIHALSSDFPSLGPLLAPSTPIQDLARMDIDRIFAPERVQQLYHLGRSQGMTLNQVMAQAFDELLSIEHITAAFLFALADEYHKVKRWTPAVQHRAEERTIQTYKEVYPRMAAFDSRIHLALQRFRDYVSFCYDQKQREMKSLIALITERRASLQDVYYIDDRAGWHPFYKNIVILLDDRYGYLGHVFVKKSHCRIIGIRTSLRYMIQKHCLIKQKQKVVLPSLARNLLQATAQWCRAYDLSETISAYQPLPGMDRILKSLGFKEDAHPLFTSNNDEPVQFAPNVFYYMLGLDTNHPNDHDMLNQLIEAVLRVLESESLSSDDDATITEGLELALGNVMDQLFEGALSA